MINTISVALELLCFALFHRHRHADASPERQEVDLPLILHQQNAERWENEDSHLTR